jgi:hypothetical protein
MDRPAYSFKIGQGVFYHAKGRPRGARTGPFTIVGMVRQQDGEILYRIKSRTHEHLAHQNELKLSVGKNIKLDEEDE